MSKMIMIYKQLKLKKKKLKTNKQTTTKKLIKHWENHLLKTLAVRYTRLNTSIYH